jgi:deaminated glutathione amidase
MNLNIAVAQLNSNDNIERNANQISELIIEASKQKIKPDIIFFPENSLYFRLDQAARLPEIKLDHSVIHQLEVLANQANIALHLTNSFFLEEKSWNASLLIQPNQKSVVTYKKIHLFDIQLVNQKPIKESDVYFHGPKPEVFEFKNLKWGSAICYDLRFAELFSYYAKQEVDVLLLPAAFLVKTGQAHWETLLRARAIESQCYVLAPAQVGIHRNETSTMSRETYGHAMIINPWGEIIQLKKDGVGLIYADLQRSECLTVRQQIPMSQHRRL